MAKSGPTDTAHRHWELQWQSEAGRADWLTPELDVSALANDLRARGASTALDLGCGVGRHALHFAELGFDTSALDGSPTALTELEKAAKSLGLFVLTKKGRMTRLPFPDSHFDYVLAFNVIYHGDPPVVRQTIAEIARVLKPGGTYQGTMLSKRNVNFQIGQEIAPDTFVNSNDGDKAHPHFYCNAAQLVALFDGFELQLLDDRLHGMPGSWHWHMIAEREI
jgi:SAM-dependent methyltransferase